MYIKKSVLSNFIIVAGGAVLLILTLLYCFTECRIPTVCFAIAWAGCILGTVAGVEHVERV